MFEGKVKNNLWTLEFALKSHEQTEELARDGEWFRNRAILRCCLVYNSVFYDLDDAIADLDKAIVLGDLRAFPSRLRGLFLLMKLTENPAASDAERKQILERVRADYQMAREREPTDGYTHLCLIEAGLLSHDWDEAITTYGESRPYVQTPEEIIVWELLGFVALALAGETIEEEDVRNINEARNREKWFKTDAHDRDWGKIYKKELEFREGILGPLLVRLRTLLLDQIRNKPGYEERWQAVNEKIHDLFDKLEVWPRNALFASLNSIERYKQAIELRCIDKIDVVDLYLIKSKYNDENQTNKLLNTLAITDKTIELEPNDTLTWYERAIILNRLERHDDALESLERVIELEPGHSTLGGSARFAKVDLLTKQERLEALDDVIRWSSTDIMLQAVAWMNKALVLENLALKLEKKGVLEDLKADKEDRTHANHWNFVDAGGEARRLREDALLAWDGAIAVRPNFAEAWLGKAKALIKLDQHEEALEALNKAILVRPYYAILAEVAHKAWSYKAALFHNKLHRYEEAIEAYDLVLEFSTEIGSSDIWLCKGDVLEKLGQYKGALEAYTKAIEKSEGFRSYIDAADAWHCKAVLCTKLERYEEALEAHDQAIKNRGTSEMMMVYEIDLVSAEWHQKGILFEKLNRHEEARQSFEKANNLRAEEAARRYESAREFAAKNKKGDAFSALEMAIWLVGDYKERVRADKAFAALWDDPDFKVLSSYKEQPRIDFKYWNEKLKNTVAKLSETDSL